MGIVLIVAEIILIVFKKFVVLFAAVMRNAA